MSKIGSTTLILVVSLIALGFLSNSLTGATIIFSASEIKLGIWLGFLLAVIGVYLGFKQSR